MHKAKKVPNELKISDMTSISKNEDALHKSNYRAISKLLTASKIFEGILFNQLQRFFFSNIYLFIFFIFALWIQ